MLINSLVELDRDKKLLSRDIILVDLRMADRVTNICERVVFLTTGKMEEFNSANY